MDDDVFGVRLMEARNSRKWTQQELAKKAGINIQTVRYYESGERRPSYVHFKALVDVLNVSADYLMGRSHA